MNGIKPGPKTLMPFMIDCQLVAPQDYRLSTSALAHLEVVINHQECELIAYSGG